MKRLGVIGGLGPMATAYFMELLTLMDDAKTDQEHFEILIHSKPQIPDRTEYILGKSKKNPFPVMAEVGEGLVRQGAEVIAIPCVSSCYFTGRLSAQLGVPILDALKDTALCLKDEGICKAGIMATDGTINSGLLQNTLKEYGVCSYLPDRKEQELVMRLIYEQAKAGKPMDAGMFTRVSSHLFSKGAEVILLACTELPLIKKEQRIGAGFLSVLDVLARSAVLNCGKLKEEYRHLISE